MSIIGTVVRWAKDAWGQLAGAPANTIRGWVKIWHYITSVHNLFAWFVGSPQLRAVLKFLYTISIFHVALVAVYRALGHLAIWIYLTWVKPGLDRLTRQLRQFEAYTLATFARFWRVIWANYEAALAYTRLMVQFERNQRIAADRAEHAAMLKAVAAALATVQRQASSGYNSETRARLSVVGRLLDDLAARQPEVRGLVALLVRAVFDLEEIDNPVLRLGIAKLLGELVTRLGVERATGDLIARLLGPWIGGARPRDLYGTERDTAARLNALEAQWAEFMTDGGPEVEQAGREWKAITGIAADAAILGVFGLAVADPAAWARGVADTIGTAGNATLDGVIRLMREV